MGRNDEPGGGAVGGSPRSRRAALLGAGAGIAALSLGRGAGPVGGVVGGLVGGLSPGRGWGGAAALPSAGPVAPVPPRPRAVAYVGNDVEPLAALEAWLGGPLDGVQLHGGSADWEDWSGSIEWLIGRWREAGRPIYWSIPLMAQGATLREVADGAFADRFERAARALAQATDGAAYVRTGWEFNGDWMHWSAVGREAEYAAAFRRFVETFRSVSDRFVFEWCPNVGHYGSDPEDAYPGDDVVDVIGMDFYYDQRWMSPDPEAAWREMVERPVGLRWHQAFAAERGKPTAYSEWGVELETAAPYLRAAAAWFREHPVLYQCYWHSDAAFRSRLHEGRMPEVGAAYRAAFGPAAR